MIDPKYKVGDIVRCAGAVCEVVACKDYTPPVTIYRDCCSVNAVCFTYDLKSSSGASFGNIPEEEISPVEEEGKEEMAKIYKFKKDDVVRLKDNHAVGIILSRDRGKSGEDFGTTNMYTIKFSSKSVIGYYKESDLEAAEFKHNVNRTTDLTGMLCYIPKQADTEFVNVDFGTKYICLDTFKPDRVLKNLVLVSCDDDSIIESYASEICPIDEERVDQDIIYKLKRSLMKKEETAESSIMSVPEVKCKDAKYKVGDHVIFTGLHRLHLPNDQYLWHDEKYIVRETLPALVAGEWKNSYGLDTLDGSRVPTWVLEEDLKAPEYHPTSEQSIVGKLSGGYNTPDACVINKDKSSMIPNMMPTRIYAPGVKIYDLGLGDKRPEPSPNIITVMVSQPLSGKTKEEIIDTRNLAILDFFHHINRKWNTNKYKIVIVDNLQFDRRPTPEEGELNHFDYLSTDIKLMKDIDYIIFAYGWQNSKGCNIEYQMAKTYGIPMYFE